MWVNRNLHPRAKHAESRTSQGASRTVDGHEGCAEHIVNSQCRCRCPVLHHHVRDHQTGRTVQGNQVRLSNTRWLVGFLLALWAVCAWGQGLQVGAGRRDITPRDPVPMWGYGDRDDALSVGVLDPLYADALVIQASGKKIAIVGLDLGRAPAEASPQRIRQRIKEQAGIENSIIAGSHTHHGPVLELTDQEGKGKGRFDAALRYYGKLEDGIVAAIVEANSRLGHG